MLFNLETRREEAKVGVRVYVINDGVNECAIGVPETTASLFRLRLNNVRQVDIAFP